MSFTASPPNSPAANSSTQANLPPVSAYQEYLADSAELERISSYRHLFHSLLLDFCGSVLVFPFISAQFLRQVQHHDISSINADLSLQPDEEFMDEMDEGIQSEELTSERQRYEEYLCKPRPLLYFDQDGHPIYAQLDDSALEFSRDELGYLRKRMSLERKSLGDSALLSTKWPLLLNKQKPIVSSIIQIARKQGILSLWQGFFVHFIYETCNNSLERLSLNSSSPLLYQDEALNGASIFHSLSKFYPNVTIPTFIAASVGLLLSPFELARSRLMAQSVWPAERKYPSSIFSTIASISREERGILGLFRNPLLTIFYHGIQPIFRVLPMILVERAAEHIGESWIGAIGILTIQIIATSAPLLVLLPAQTIRRRLQLQSNPLGAQSSAQQPYISRVPIVQLSSYTSAINCFRRMIREEGWRSLYQGWTQQFLLNTAAILLSAVVGLEEEENDDLEAF